MKKITVLSGDGVGPEVMTAAVSVLKALTNDIEIISADCGYECYRRTGESLPVSTIESIDESDAVLMGGITIPSNDRSFRNPITEIERRMRLELDIRHIESIIPDLSTVDIDATFVRNVSDDINLTEIDNIVSSDITISFPYSEMDRTFNSSRWYAEKKNSRNILFAHQNDRTKSLETAYMESFRRCMEGTNIPYDDVDMAGLIAMMLTRPDNIDMVISHNPFSDILSDVAAKLTGGSYLVPCAAVNRTRGLFRPLHGSIPSMAGYNSTNPTASLRCTAMMLDFLGYETESETLWEAIRSAYKRGFRTPDVGGGTGMFGFIEQIIKICENHN